MSSDTPYVSQLPGSHPPGQSHHAGRHPGDLLHQGTQGRMKRSIGGTCLNECVEKLVSRVPGQNGVSLLHIMLEIHYSGREPRFVGLDLWDR